MCWEWKRTSSYGSNVMLPTTFSARVSPLTTVRMVSDERSSISSRVTTAGPKLKNASKLFV